jgi:uncharacterized protein YjbI with pentapeptide repeats
MTIRGRERWEFRRGVAELIAAHMGWLARLEKGPGQLVAKGLSLDSLALHTLSLRHARFDSCDFSNVYAPMANFDGGEFIDCSFVGADAESMHFLEATLTRCDFSRSHIAGTAFGGRITECRFDFAGLAAASFSDATCERLDFSTADLLGVIIQRTVLRDCNLAGRDLTGGSAFGAEFRSCDLRGVSWAGAVIMDAQFVDCLIGQGSSDVDPPESVSAVLQGCRRSPEGPVLTSAEAHSAMGWPAPA